MGKYHINTKSYILIFLYFLIAASFFADQELVVNIIMFGICLISLFYNPKFLIFLFVVLLPTNGIFSTEENLFEYFSLLTTSHFFVTIYLLFNYKKILRISNTSDTNKDIRDIQNLSSLIIISLFLFLAYSDIKNGLFGIYDIDLNMGIRRLVKSIFRFLPLVLLIKLLVVEDIARIVKLGMLTGVIFLVITSFFTDQLMALNLLAKDISDIGYGNYGFVKRHSGFFGWGDVNSFGALLVIFLGYYFYIYSRRANFLIFQTTLVLVFIAIIYTGSRTTFISLIAFFSIFAFTQKGTLKYKYLLLATVGVFTILLVPEFNYAFNSVIGRFAYASQELDTRHTGTRIAKWLMYYYYMMDNTYIFLTGTFKEFWLDLSMENWRFFQRRVPHNLYIWMLFQSGFVPVTILIYSISKILIKAKRFLESFYLVLPFLMISMYVSDWGYAYYFSLMLPIMYIEKAAKDQISSLQSK